jgi:hypothetical protein
MKLLKNKTAYIFRERRGGYYTALLSHTFMPYRKHKINRQGIPIFYFTEINEDVLELLKSYKLIYRKPRITTIRRMQLTLLLDLFYIEKTLMLLDKPYGTQYWTEAVDIYWNCIWKKAGLNTMSVPDYKIYSGLTAPQIYDLLVLSNNNINLN